MYLSHFVSQASHLSRRKSAEAIKQGQIKVNGQTVTNPAAQIDPEKDQINYRNQKITPAEKNEYVILNKPSEYICSKADRHNSKTIYALLPKDFETLHYVGRLDKNSTGLILLTNDGKLTYTLTHPKFKHEKEYKLKIRAKLTSAQKQQLESGIALEDGQTAPAKIKNVTILKTKNHFITTLDIIIREGKKRILRRMFQKLNLHVINLHRTRIAKIELGDLKSGNWRTIEPPLIKT